MMKQYASKRGSSRSRLEAASEFFISDHVHSNAVVERRKASTHHMEIFQCTGDLHY